MIPFTSDFLKDGLYVEVVLPYIKTPNAVLIKNAAISTDQAGEYVYTVTESKDGKGYMATYTHIVTGPVINDSLKLVTSGLSRETMYITGGLMKLRNGMPVNPHLN